MVLRRSCLYALLALWFTGAACAQVIEFESGGLKYQTLTRNGVTVMFAPIASHVREYAVIQVAVSNGSSAPRTIRPEDFTFVRQDGTETRGSPALVVVNELVDKANRNDVIKMVHAYEMGIYGMDRFRITNGYEQRRQQALAEVSSTKIKAAAAASAIVLVWSKLTPGQSTDGAVFFRTAGKLLGPGKLVVRTGGDTFEFPSQ